MLRLWEYASLNLLSRSWTCLCGEKKRRRRGQKERRGEGREKQRGGEWRGKEGEKKGVVIKIKCR